MKSEIEPKTESAKSSKRRYLLESAALKRPHPLAKLPERLGRSPGRSPLPDLFEQFLRDQIARPNVPPPSCSALLPSRSGRARRRQRTRRPDC